MAIRVGTPSPRPSPRLILFSVDKPPFDPPEVGVGFWGEVLLLAVGVEIDVELGVLVLEMVVSVVRGGIFEVSLGVVEAGVEVGVDELPNVFVPAGSPPVSSAAISEIDDIIESGNSGTSTGRSGSSQQDPDSAACWQQKVFVFAQNIRLSHLLGVSVTSLDIHQLQGSSSRHTQFTHLRTPI